jgi:hypothetical protein
MKQPQHLSPEARKAWEEARLENSIASLSLSAGVPAAEGQALREWISAQPGFRLARDGVVLCGYDMPLLHLIVSYKFNRKSPT